MAKKFNSVEHSAVINNLTYSSWFNRFYNIALSMFKWLNVPDSIDTRFIEKCLFWNGSVLIFSDEELGILGLPYNSTGYVNPYGIPIYRTPYSTNYNGDTKSEKDSVIIFNNYSHSPDWAVVKLYSTRLYEIERTMDVNIKSQKQPIIINCDEKQKLTMINAFEQYDGNIPVILSTNHYLNDSFTVLNLSQNYNLDKLNQLKHELYYETLSYLGVENSRDKKEREYTTEILSNLGEVEANRITKLKTRQEACNKINSIFGTNIWCEYDSSLTLSRYMEGVINE